MSHNNPEQFEYTTTESATEKHTAACNIKVGDTKTSPPFLSHVTMLSEQIITQPNEHIVSIHLVSSAYTMILLKKKLK